MKKNLHIGIVASRFNGEFVDALLQNCINGLKGCSITVLRVPGSFEIPLAAKSLLKNKKISAVIALGLIWQGKTAHAGLIGQEVSRALMNLSLEFEKPVIHQVLSVQNEKQARERCFGKKLNRGTEAARAALSCLKLNT
ncbi:MAG: 6,7-dimethyl-8-ribityllumazine synthase [Methylacidiphilales bacterium]|nr:6,7-dimethyl-8-ribityllumazine synthase [Candidatus Methylacidiphilales bacterium]